MSFPKMTEMHTNCIRFGKIESIFSQPLLNFIKIQLKLAFDSIHIFRSIAQSKSHRHIKNIQHRDSGILQCC